MNIDANSLKLSAGHRRRHAERGWNCPHCKKTFVHEKTFMKHECKEKRRAEEIKTVTGQTAYQYYTAWMKAKKRKAPSIDTFITSQFYLAFMNFTNLVINLKIDKPDLYIRLMSRRDISPTMWCHNQSYSIYLEFCEKDGDPAELVAKSLDVLEKIAEVHKVKLGDVFVQLGFRQVLEMIKLRQLSAWLLLHSNKFAEFLGSLDEDDMRHLSGALNVNFWVTYLEDKGPIRAELREIIQQMGL